MECERLPFSQGDQEIKRTEETALMTPEFSLRENSDVAPSAEKPV
jgi:hypothetical protein